MGNWNVTVVFDASKGVDVEADNAEEAVEKAYDAVGGASLCHHCARELDVGDPVFALAYGPDGEEHTDDRQAIEIERLRGTVEDLQAALLDAEQRAENAGRNASAFEERMGDLQVENGRLRDRLAELRAKEAASTSAP